MGGKKEGIGEIEGKVESLIGSKGLGGLKGFSAFSRVNDRERSPHTRGRGGIRERRIWLGIAEGGEELTKEGEEGEELTKEGRRGADLGGRGGKEGLGGDKDSSKPEQLAERQLCHIFHCTHPRPSVQLSCLYLYPLM